MKITLKLISVSCLILYVNECITIKKAGDRNQSWEAYLIRFTKPPRIVFRYAKRDNSLNGTADLNGSIDSTIFKW